MTTRLFAERLGVGKKATRQILERDLKKRKISSRFISQSLWQYGKNFPQQKIVRKIRMSR